MAPTPTVSGCGLWSKQCRENKQHTGKNAERPTRKVLHDSFLLQKTAYVQMADSCELVKSLSKKLYIINNTRIATCEDVNSHRNLHRNLHKAKGKVFLQIPRVTWLVKTALNERGCPEQQGDIML